MESLSLFETSYLFLFLLVGASGGLIAFGMLRANNKSNEKNFEKLEQASKESFVRLEGIINQGHKDLRQEMHKEVWEVKKEVQSQITEFKGEFNRHLEANQQYVEQIIRNNTEIEHIKDRLDKIKSD